MQLIKLSLDHWNFYCPVTGEKITGDGEELNQTRSLKGVWIGEEIGEAMIFDPQLQEAWDTLLENLPEDADLDDELLHRFLENYKAPNWVVFYICAGTDSLNSSDWFIIDMNSQKE